MPYVGGGVQKKSKIEGKKAHFFMFFCGVFSPGGLIYVGMGVVGDWVGVTLIMLFTSLALFLGLCCSNPPPSSPMWYAGPPTRSLGGYPIGNGILGGGVFYIKPIEKIKKRLRFCIEIYIENKI